MASYVHARRQHALPPLRRWLVVGAVAVAITLPVVAMTAAALIVLLSQPASAEQVQAVVLRPEPAPVYDPAGPSLRYPPAYAAPVTIAGPPRTRQFVNMHLGPNDQYVVVGTLPGGANLQVLGRDESAEWLAVTFPPNSDFHAWLPVSAVLGLRGVEDLDIAPVRLLP